MITIRNNALRMLTSALLLMCCVEGYADDFIYDRMYYETIDDRTVKVKGYGYDPVDMIIPETVYNGDVPYTVTRIAETVFSFCKYLTSIKIPRSLTSIGDKAFYYCEKLATIIFAEGSSLTSIEEDAFENCSALISITIPSSVTSIGAGAFKYCNSLTSVTMEGTEPPALGSGAFSGCTLSAIYVPASSVDKYKNNIDWIYYRDIIISLSEYKNSAIAAINAAMEGNTGSAYLQGLVSEDIESINNATEKSAIDAIKDNAISKIAEVIDTYKAAKSEAFGALGEKQEGPSVEVIDQSDKKIILYNPKRVIFGKATSK